MGEQWMTVKEVALYLQLSTDLIYRYAQRCYIPATKVGSRWRFSRDQIDKWMLSQQPKQPVGGPRNVR